MRIIREERQAPLIFDDDTIHAQANQIEWLVIVNKGTQVFDLEDNILIYLVVHEGNLRYTWPSALKASLDYWWDSDFVQEAYPFTKEIGNE